MPKPDQQAESTGHNSVDPGHLRAFVERIRNVLAYNAETGELVWRVTLSNRAPAGQRAGNLSQGYRDLAVDGIRLRATTAIWLIVFGRFPRGLIDHRNGRRGDDWLLNLREATYQENARNVRRHFDNHSGFKGVTFHHGRSRPWQARIFIAGRNRSLGYYSDPARAHSAYIMAAKREFGDFARAS